MPTGAVPLLETPTLLNPSPQSNPGTTSYTTGCSVTVGGSVGINEAQGFNAILNASVTVTNTQTVTVPPISTCNSRNFVLRVGLANLKSAAVRVSILPEAIRDSTGAPEARSTRI